MPVSMHSTSANQTAKQHEERYNMTKITYEVVEHDGGWAYQVDGVLRKGPVPKPGSQSGRSRSEGANRSRRGYGHF